MPTIKKNWGSTYQHDWNDDSWTTGSPTTAAETLSGTTESLTGGINLLTEGYEGIQLTVDINADPTPTDDIELNVYASLDGTNWDEMVIRKILIDFDLVFTDPCQITTIVTGYAYLRIGFVQTGSTDSHDISTVYYKPWNWSVT